MNTISTTCLDFCWLVDSPFDKESISCPLSDSYDMSILPDGLWNTRGPMRLSGMNDLFSFFSSPHIFGVDRPVDTSENWNAIELNKYDDLVQNCNVTQHALSKLINYLNGIFANQIPSTGHLRSQI